LCENDGAIARCDGEGFSAQYSLGASDGEMMEHNLFTNGIQAQDQKYNIISDSQTPNVKRSRSFIEGLWRKYQPYADRHFNEQMQVDVDSRFWEMYLACTLLEESIPLSSADAGPDIFIEDENGRTWIEAIAPTGGADTNPDRIPDMKPGVATIVPDDEIVLRYRAAIKEKYDNKYYRYVEMGLIMPGDAYVIAINSCKIQMAIMETDTPRILKAVFPIGNWQITMDKRTGIVVDGGYQRRYSIRRVGGAEVRTDLFLNLEYANLSGVLYSHVNVWNVPKKMGEDFVLIHNPLAGNNRLPYGFLKVGREYAATKDDDGYAIEVTDWN